MKRVATLFLISFSFLTLTGEADACHRKKQRCVMQSPQACGTCSPTPSTYSSTHYYCLYTYGGQDEGQHYFYTYQNALDSRAYYFARGATAISGPYDCYYP